MANKRKQRAAERLGIPKRDRGLNNVKFVDVHLTKEQETELIDMIEKGELKPDTAKQYAVDGVKIAYRVDDFWDAHACSISKEVLGTSVVLTGRGGNYEDAELGMLYRYTVMFGEDWDAIYEYEEKRSVGRFG
mgnify:CR=1 FL=1